MRKKILSAIFAAALICLSALCLFGCGGDSDSGERSASLTYGKKYISVDYVNADEDKMTYFIFNRNGTAIYKRYYQYGYSEDYKISSYEITYKYAFDGEYVDMFFDSVKYLPEHTAEQSVESTRKDTYVASKNFLRSGQYDSIYYICEDYLKNIPNFGKKAA